MEGTMTVDGTTYSFKCARVQRDPNGPDVTGFIPCNLRILVNAKAFATLAGNVGMEVSPAQVEAPSSESSATA